MGRSSDYEVEKLDLRESAALLTDGRSVGRPLVRTSNLIIRVGCALVVCRISASGIRKAVLMPIRIMNDKGRYHSR